MSLARRSLGLLRTLAYAYGVPGRQRRMRRFYRAFIGAGELAFDVGAHAGNRVAAWRGLGARVVAVEPQPDLVRLLHLLHGRDDGVVIEATALGGAPGRARMRTSRNRPTCSSIEPAWVDRMSRSPVFSDVVWDGELDVAVSSLDQLIARHGMPVFAKIDVEGAEPAVLAGLSRPLRALSFEALPPALDAAARCLDRLERLAAADGGYEYNYSPVESMRLVSPAWLDRAALERELARRAPLGRSGDVYARLRVLA